MQGLPPLTLERRLDSRIWGGSTLGSWLGLADAPLLAGACRSTLLVVESSKTRTKAAIDAINRLRAAGGHIVGAVLTKFRHQAHGYGYGYGYEPYRYDTVAGRDREIKLIAQRES